MYKRITGQLLYTSDKAGREGEERGHEFFTMTIHPDGCRTLEAHSEIDDEPTVLRHVTMSFDPRWNVTDGFVRIVVNGQFVGSSWFRFAAGAAECEGYTVNEGRLSQSFEVKEPLDGFGAHAIECDAILCQAYPVADGPGSKVLSFMISSTNHRGATGPTLIPVKHRINFVGKEKIEVRAGTFDAYHFTFGQEGDWDADDPIKHPVYHLWCTADGNYIVLRAQVMGYMQTSYELTSLDTNL